MRHFDHSKFVALIRNVGNKDTGMAKLSGKREINMRGKLIGFVSSVGAYLSRVLSDASIAVGDAVKMLIFTVLTRNDMRKNSLPPRPSRSTTLKWKTRDGRRLRVRDMDDVHLVNARYRLESLALKYVPTYEANEGVKLIINVDAYRKIFWLYFDEEFLRRYDALCAEWKRRKIDDDPLLTLKPKG